MTDRLQLLTLRDGGTHDLPSVNAIMQDAFDPRFGEAWTQAQCMGMLALPGVWLTLAALGEDDAGFAMARLTADEAELLLLATRPRLRRRGVGGALLRGVIAEARRRGAGTIHLEVRAGNDAATLYLGQGFVKVGQRRDYYKGKTGQLFDAYTFSKNLR